MENLTDFCNISLDCFLGNIKFVCNLRISLALIALFMPGVLSLKLFQGQRI